MTDYRNPERYGGRQPWERSDKLDTNETWPYFKAYRDARKGTRRLEVIRYSPATDVRNPIDRTKAPPLSTIHQWAKDGFWVERVAAYDSYLDDLQRTETEAALAVSAQDMAAERRHILGQGLELVKDQLAKFFAQASASDFASLKPGELVKLMEWVSRNSRLEAGEATEKVEVHQDLSSLSDEELNQLYELQKKIEKP